MVLARIGTLVAGGVVVALALIACAAMLVAFRIQRSHGRWGGDGGEGSEPDERSRD